MIEFNRIYVIESLPFGDEKTGTRLHNELLQWLQYRFDGFVSILLEPKNKLEWDRVMSRILDDTQNKGGRPIIHFEIHGSTNKDGLVLASRELVSWKEMGSQLTAINIASRMNLFVSLAVCHGAYLLTQYHMNQRAFCFGVLGSFDALKVSDLKIRFNEFYEELFTSFDVVKAYQRLLNANPGVDEDYECISALEMFYKNYRNYILKEVEDPERVKERALEAAQEAGIVLDTQEKIEAFQRDFAKALHQTKEKYYVEHSTNFLMTDLFPEKKEDFNIPATLEEFMNSKVIPQNYIDYK